MYHAYFRALLEPKNYYYAKSQGMSADWFDGMSPKYFILLLEDFHKETIVVNPDETFAKLAAVIIRDNTIRSAVLVYVAQVTVAPVCTDIVATTNMYRTQYLSRVLSDDLLQVTKSMGKGNYVEAVQKLQELSAATANAITEATEADLRSYYFQTRNEAMPAGLQTGFPSIDSATTGLHGGEFVAIMSGSGEGKTTLLMNIAWNVMKQGKKVLYISIEMPVRKLFQRFQSIITGIPHMKSKRNELTSADQQHLEQEMQRLHEMPAYFRMVDAPMASPALVEAKINIDKNRPDIVIVDYLAILQSTASSNKASWEVMSQLTLELRALARKYNIPVLTAVQVHRSAVDKPKDFYEQQDIALSYPVIQHADVVISIKIPNKDVLHASPHCNLNGKFVKDRDGEHKTFLLCADFGTYRMWEPTTQFGNQPPQTS